MILDAQEWLLRARDGFADPAEVKAIDDLLEQPPIVAVPSVLDGGKVVWLFTGGIHQLAVPLELMPDLTRHAREAGLLGKFVAAFEAEVDELVASVRRALEVT